MAWAKDSKRKASLPKNWPAICKPVLKRDGYRCQWGSLETDKAPFGLCERKAREVDHKGASDDHRPENLRSLCTPHHAKRSARQGGKASGDARTARVAARYRPPDRHPGLLTPEELAAKAGPDQRS